MRTYEADPHTRGRAGHQLHAELRLYLQLSLHETHVLENATCQGTQEHISLCTPKSTISLNYIWKTKVGQLLLKAPADYGALEFYTPKHRRPLSQNTRATINSLGLVHLHGGQGGHR